MCSKPVISVACENIIISDIVIKNSCTYFIFSCLDESIISIPIASHPPTTNPRKLKNHNNTYDNQRTIFRKNTSVLEKIIQDSNLTEYYECYTYIIYI